MSCSLLEGQGIVQGMAWFPAPEGRPPLHASPLQTASRFLPKEGVPSQLMSPAVKVDSSSAREKWDGTMPKLLFLKGFRWLESQRALLSPWVGRSLKSSFQMNLPGVSSA